MHLLKRLLKHTDDENRVLKSLLKGSLAKKLDLVNEH